MASLTLNLRGQSTIKIPKTLLSQDPTFVLRYWLVAEIISQLSKGKFKDQKIIDVGGNGSLLPKLLDDKIDILDLPDNDYENYIQASALQMPLENNAYEIVVSCDVYEHIPEKDRGQFIKELLRVSKNYVVLCGPMFKEETVEAEKRTDVFFKNLFGHPHPWLQEHINYTLPRGDKLEKILDKEKLTFSRFDHGSLSLWEIMTKINFLMVGNDIAQDNKIAPQIKALNKFYIEELGYKDFPIRGYRTIYIIAKKQAQPISIDLPVANDLAVNVISTHIGTIIENLAGSLRGNHVELGNIRKELLNTKEDLTAQLEAFKAEVESIYNSRSWKLVAILRKFAAPIFKFLRKTHLLTLLRFVRKVITKAAERIPFINRSLVFLRTEIQRQRNQHQREYEYREWLRHHQPSQDQIEEQKTLSNLFNKKPLISLIVPTYNTNPKFLEVTLNSVLDQSYDKWELCIADDASKNQKVREIIEEYAKKDSRIKYIFREDNGHICEASNSALELATGEYIALLDHDDFLWPNALYEVVAKINAQPELDFIYTDEDKIDEKGIVHSQPFFKPAWSPDYLRSLNYITHFAVIKRELVSEVGGFRKGYEGAQDWDLFLRVSRLTNNISHIPKILYSWRKSITSTALNASAKNYAYKNQRKVLFDDATARGLKIKSIKWAIQNLTWEPQYEINNQPKVSIIIPTKDQYNHINKCLKSIKRRTTYSNLEILIVDTGSTDERVWKLYNKYKNKFKDFKVVHWQQPFNFALVCNLGAKKAKGDYFLFLNNDTEVISRNWIEGLLQYAQQPHVGAVGCKLLYPNGTLQHAGVVLGVGGSGETPGVAGHMFPAYRDNPIEDWAQTLYVGGARDFSAVTGACLMVSKAKFDKVKGFDGQFKIAWNDVDFCLKLHREGWYNIYTPYIKLYHHESISVGLPGSKTRDLDLFNKEIKHFGQKWGWDYIGNDPYYSPQFRKDVANARLDLSS